MSWQILEGVSRIPVTLFEAVVELDSGPIYLQQYLHLQGHELVNEWRSLLAQPTNELCLEWLDRCARGFGLAADLVRLGLQVMEQTW